jgi:hypothetical protein
MNFLHVVHIGLSAWGGMRLKRSKYFRDLVIKVALAGGQGSSLARAREVRRRGQQQQLPSPPSPSSSPPPSPILPNSFSARDHDKIQVHY